MNPAITRPTSPKARLLAATLLAALTAINVYATPHTFNGSISSDWAISGNWNSSSIAPTSGVFSQRRVNVNGASLIYSAAQGDTVYNNSSERGFVISSGSLSITGGNFTSNNPTLTTEDVLGNSASTTSTLAINGGNYTTNALTMNFSGGTATVNLNVQSGTASIGVLKVQSLTGGTSTVNLDGGTLAVGTVNATGVGTKILNLNGGTFRTTSGLTLTSFTNAFVKSGGAIIDTNGFNSIVAQDLLTDTVSTGGGLTKQGEGTLTLSGGNTYTGATTIEAGTLALGAANRIADSSSLVMAGGTFATGGFSETLDTLDLTANSVIDLGDGASALVFANSSGEAWAGGSISLSFVNFTEGLDSVRIGTSASGLTELQLAQITINGLAAIIDADGFLSVANIPEPSTYAALAGVGAMALASAQRRRRSAGAKA